MAVNLQVLNSELISDPLARGYSGMSDAAAAADLNTVYRSRQRAWISGSEVFNATDDVEFAALTDVQKDRWVALCAVASIDVDNGVAKAMEAALFGPATDTRSNLTALRAENISRAEELGLGVVTPGDVNKARAYPA
jgi:hypothetical protein